VPNLFPPDTRAVGDLAGGVQMGADGRVRDQHAIDHQTIADVLAAAYPSSGLTVAGSSISDATTNTALVTVPAAAVAGAVAGSVFYMHGAVILASPASAMPTIAFHAYSGGSAGTVLDNFAAATMTASLLATFSIADIEAWVEFYSATTVQAVLKASVSNSGSASTALNYVAGNASATPVTVVAGTKLTLNAVMGSAVAASSFQGIFGFWDQVA
jgi:hypothetical protein